MTSSWPLLLLLLLLLLLAVKQGDSTENSLNCSEILVSETGVDDEKDFFEWVAHGVHSITLEDLRHYFNPEVGEDNGIPNVNVDLTSDQVVLPNAPRAKGGYDRAVRHLDGFRTVDYVLSNRPDDFSIRGTTVIEKIAHEFHMQEMWTAAALEYTELEMTLPPLGEDFCACATDGDKLMETLEDLAILVRTGRRKKQQQDEQDRSSNSWHQLYLGGTVPDPETRTGDLPLSWKPGMISGTGDESDRRAWSAYAQVLESMMDRKGMDVMAKYLHCKIGRRSRK